VKKLVLIGCGEAHAEVLRQMAASPAANADVTLVSPSSSVLQSACVPGLVAGHFNEADCRNDLTPLLRAAGVRHVADRVAGLDMETRIAVTAGGDEFEFDFASVDVGATSLNPDVPGLGKFALLAQPVDVFLQGWERVRELAQEGALSRLTVVGGGVEAVELLLAMHFNLRRSLSPDAFAACGFSIVTEGERLIETLPESLGRAAEAACLARGISLLRGAGVVEVERDAALVARLGRPGHRHAGLLRHASRHGVQRLAHARLGRGHSHHAGPTHRIATTRGHAAKQPLAAPRQRLARQRGANSRRRAHAHHGQPLATPSLQ
jgi:selenide,water dikinase